GAPASYAARGKHVKQSQGAACVPDRSGGGVCGCRAGPLAWALARLRGACPTGRVAHDPCSRAAATARPPHGFSAPRSRALFLSRPHSRRPVVPKFVVQGGKALKG